MSDPIPHRRRPCAECPWRRDTDPGQFTAERYEALRNTTGGPGNEAPLGSPLFACHKSPVGHEEACAGWLAAVGVDSIEVRLAVAMKRLPAAAITPGDGWPALFASYEEMAEAQGRRQ